MWQTEWTKCTHSCLNLLIDEICNIKKRKKLNKTQKLKQKLYSKQENLPELKNLKWANREKLVFIVDLKWYNKMNVECFAWNYVNILQKVSMLNILINNYAITEIEKNPCSSMFHNKNHKNWTMNVVQLNQNW